MKRPAEQALDRCLQVVPDRKRVCKIASATISPVRRQLSKPQHAQQLPSAKHNPKLSPAAEATSLAMPRGSKATALKQADTVRQPATGKTTDLPAKHHISGQPADALPDALMAATAAEECISVAPVKKQLPVKARPRSATASDKPSASAVAPAAAKQKAGPKQNAGKAVISITTLTPATGDPDRTRALDGSAVKAVRPGAPRQFRKVESGNSGDLQCDNRIKAGKPAATAIGSTHSSPVTAANLRKVKKTVDAKILKDGKAAVPVKTPTTGSLDTEDLMHGHSAVKALKSKSGISPSQHHGSAAALVEVKEPSSGICTDVQIKQAVEGQEAAQPGCPKQTNQQAVQPAVQTVSGKRKIGGLSSVFLPMVQHTPNVQHTELLHPRMPPGETLEVAAVQVRCNVLLQTVRLKQSDVM